MKSFKSELQIEYAPLARLKPYSKNARTHSKQQIAQIAKSIEAYGFNNPVKVDDDLMIIAGHARVEAAKSLGMKRVPIVKLSHLDQTQKRAYILADNRLAEKSGWDKELLALELEELVALELNVESIGFEIAEVDLILSAATEANPAARGAPEDVIPAREDIAIARPGDLWTLGRHRLFCGDARDTHAYNAVLGQEDADLLFTDPPYNVPIQGNVSGKGRIKHREFAEASGDMSKAEFEVFLQETITNAAERLSDGALAFIFMDWRHMSEMLKAGEVAFNELKNLCVWTKANGGMGSFYRSQHELIFVFKNGTAAHLNTVELGRHGRNRSNVWAYAGVNGFSAERDQALRMHPTVKPVALIEDAIKDASRRGGVVLDCFGGSGSTLIAAEKCGRAARLIEIDPPYCDVILKRYAIFTGREAVLDGDGRPFSEIAAERTPVALQGDQGNPA